MYKDKIYKFGELTWVVGYSELNTLITLPAIYNGKYLIDIYGNEIYCENIKEGVEKLLNKFELRIAPNACSLVNENSVIRGIDVFKLSMYGLKEKATVFANNFHYQSLVFNVDDYYNIKVMNKEFTGEKLHWIGVKATNSLRNYHFKEIEKKQNEVKEENINTL